MSDSDVFEAYLSAAHESRNNEGLIMADAPIAPRFLAPTRAGLCLDAAFGAAIIR